MALLSTKHATRYKQAKVLTGVHDPTSDLKAYQSIYHCAQDRHHKKGSAKVAKPEKQHDRPTMPTYDCKSHLRIQLQVLNGLLTISIDLKHCDNHIPYCDKFILDDVLIIIKVGGDKEVKEVQIYAI